jgi:hypothetical protein
MKARYSLLRFILFIQLFFVLINSKAQTGLNFQGVARTNNNIILASQPISLRLSILQGSATGIAEYVETRRVTTNAQGLFTAVIGDTGAISTLGNFTTINWRNTPKFLKIEMDVAAGNNFTTMGTTQFQYVAYAQFANSVDAENITGVVPVARGGTGANSLSSFKTTLALNNVNNTSDLSKPISTATQTVLDLKLNASDTVKYVKYLYADSALLTKLKLSDTASMLSNRIGKDTLNLSSRINLKANISDLTTGLDLKLNKMDTSSLSNRIDLKANSSDMTSGLLLKENALNKSTATDLGGTSPSDILYPTQKAVKDYVTANASSGGVADGGITTIKLADGAVTDAKINTVSGSKVIGNITGNAATAILATNAITAGNITATSNSTLTSLPNLTSVGTITSGTWSGTTIAVASGGTGTGTATANSVFAGPYVNDVGPYIINGVPNFRPLSYHDIPDLSLRYIVNNSVFGGNNSGGANFNSDITVSGQKIGIGGNTIEGRLNLLFGKNALSTLGVYNTNPVVNMNTAIGQYSQFDTYGNKNTSLGTFSLSHLGEGYNNTVIGAFSNTQNNLDENKFVDEVMHFGGGDDNTSIGAYALSYTRPSDEYKDRKYNSFNKNTVIGAYSLSGLSADAPNPMPVVSNGNTAIGYKAGSTLEIGSNNIIIGDSAQASTTTTDNQITLGNSRISSLRAQVTSITALSDRRDKTDIIALGEGLSFLKKLNPVSFTWNTRDKAKVGIKSAGFIAQELLALQKESKIGDNLDLVSQDNPEKLEARYANLLPVIVKAIQEESAEKDKKLNDQAKEIKALKERLNLFEKRLNQLLEKKK